jgi:hypothetical protein
LEKLGEQDRRNWMTTRDDDPSLRAFEAFQEEVRNEVDPVLEELMNQNAAPSSLGVQKILARYEQLMAKYQIRTATVERFSKQDIYPDAELNSLSLQARDAMLLRLKRRPTGEDDLLAGQWTSNPFLLPYFSEAELHSAQRKEVDALLLEARPIVGETVRSTSKEAQELVGRFANLCRDYALGDPLMYARWANLVRPPPGDLSEAEDRMIWSFIEEAMRACGEFANVK